MHMKVPFLVVLVLSFFQILVYAFISTEAFDDILTVDPEHVNKIELIDFSNQMHVVKDPQQIEAILDYFRQYEYQHHPDDQTAYMPKRTIMISLYDQKHTDFIIPYGKEVLVSHKVYSLANEGIDQDALLRLFDAKP